MVQLMMGRTDEPLIKYFAIRQPYLRVSKITDKVGHPNQNVQPEKGIKVDAIVDGAMKQPGHCTGGQGGSPRHDRKVDRVNPEGSQRRQYLG